MGRAHAKDGGAPKRVLQALGNGHRSGLASLEERRFSPLFGCSLWRVRARAADVRLGLAGVPARRELSAGVGNRGRIRARLRGGRQRKNLWRQCRPILWFENGATWTCRLKTKWSSSPAVPKESVRPSLAVVRARVPSRSSWTRRSEERRVGEECRSRWSPDHLKKKKK